LLSAYSILAEDIVLEKYKQKRRNNFVIPKYTLQDTVRVISNVKEVQQAYLSVHSLSNYTRENNCINLYPSLDIDIDSLIFKEVDMICITL